MDYRKKVILVDVDGTLCTGICWTPEECLVAVPRLDVIKKINKIAEEAFIVIYTARRNHLIPATLEWLHKNGVHFQAISNNKISGDLMIDDIALNVEDL